MSDGEGDGDEVIYSPKLDSVLQIAEKLSAAAGAQMVMLEHLRWALSEYDAQRRENKRVNNHAFRR